MVITAYLLVFVKYVKFKNIKTSQQNISIVTSYGKTFSEEPLVFRLQLKFAFISSDFLDGIIPWERVVSGELTCLKLYTFNLIINSITSNHLLNCSDCLFKWTYRKKKCKGLISTILGDRSRHKYRGDIPKKVHQQNRLTYNSWLCGLFHRMS